MRSPASWLVLVALLLVPQEAELGRVHLNNIALEFLVQRSPLILVAEPVETVQTDIPIRQLGMLRKKVPPFVKIDRVYAVFEVLKGAMSIRKAPRITVAPANLETRHRIYRDYHVKGLSRSYAEERYETSLPPEDLEKRQIIFVRPYQWRGRPQHQFVVGGSYEAIERRPEVLRLIAAASAASPAAEHTALPRVR